MTPSSGEAMSAQEAAELGRQLGEAKREREAALAWHRGYYGAGIAAGPPARLSFVLDRPTLEGPPQHGARTSPPGPRMRLVVEGEFELVQRILDVVQPTLAAIVEEAR